jgi:hypothetical protein
VARTVYVNDALWKKIKTSQAVPLGKLAVDQCNSSAKLEVWALPGIQLQIADQAGFGLTKDPMFPAYYIVPLKQEPVGSPRGGIATRTTPAAMLGSSFLRSFGTVVIDPGAFTSGGAVWIKMPDIPAP